MSKPRTPEERAWAISFGARLKSIRRTTFPAQAMFAAALGDRSQQAVSLNERGETLPSVARLLRYAEVLRTSLPELVNSADRLSGVSETGPPFPSATDELVAIFRRLPAPSQAHLLAYARTLN